MIAKITAPILMKAKAETASHASQIQGFCDGSRHYVRDLTLDPGQQTRWTVHAGEDRYAEVHDQMMEEIERLQAQLICEWLWENSPVTYHDI